MNKVKMIGGNAVIYLDDVRFFVQASLDLQKEDMFKDIMEILYNRNNDGFEYNSEATFKRLEEYRKRKCN